MPQFFRFELFFAEQWLQQILEIPAVRANYDPDITTLEWAGNSNGDYQRTFTWLLTFMSSATQRL
jgi:hypothetical protein